ncbi:MAG: insulinase family protein [Gammaproteobacteria bacterium]|nr:insulinase family protein [Gammaproteobacteria bacterium]
MRHSKRTLTAAILLALSGSSLATDSVDIPYTKFSLDNGLTVLVHEDHKAPIVAVNVWYHVGSKDEKRGKTGFAHLFEHLMFNGSENHPGEYFDPFEKAGATEQNGTTWLDRTNYFQNVPTTALDMALWMESDRMGHLLGAIDQKKLDEQRGVVQNEKRQGENQPYGRAWEQIQKAVFPEGHPYSWETIGSMEDLNAASLDDVREWFKTYYGTANAVLVLAGDIDAATAKQKVEHYFGDIPAGPPLTQREAWVAKRSESTRDLMFDRVPQTKIYKVWNTPAFGAKETDQLDLLASLLGGGKNSRLYKTLVYDQQVATAVNVANQSFELASMFMLEVDVKPGVDAKLVERLIEAELAALLKKGPSKDELVRVQAGLEAQFVRNVEKVGGFGGKSDVLATYQTYLGDAGAFRRSLDNYRNATVKELHQVAKSWLSSGDYTLEIRPFPDYKTAAAGADRGKLPEMKSSPNLDFPAVQRAKLDNGIPVVFAERHAVPTLQISLQFDAGYAADQGGKLGATSFTSDMLDEGTSSLSALELSDRLERLGAKLNTGDTLDTSFVRLDALKRNLDESLGLMADVTLNPAFDATELERLRAQRLAGIQQEKADPTSLALRLLPPLLYGDKHAYGIPFTGSGTEEAVKSITREDLVRQHATWLRPDIATLIVTGDTTLAELLPKLNKTFGGWKVPASPLPAKNIAEVALPAAPRVFLVDKPGAQQSVIIAGSVIPPLSKDMARNAAVTAMNDALGGQFSARLNMNLREDKHWAYGAYTWMTQAKGMRPYMAYAPVQTDKTKESLLELQKELRDYAGAKPTTKEEVSRSVLNNVRSLPGEFESGKAVLAALSNIVTYGRPDNYVELIKPAFEGLDVKAVQATAKELVRPDALTWVVVGDLSKIEQDVRGLKLGEVQVLSGDGKVLR